MTATVTKNNDCSKRYDPNQEIEDKIRDEN